MEEFNYRRDNEEGMIGLIDCNLGNLDKEDIDWDRFEGEIEWLTDTRFLVEDNENNDKYLEILEGISSDLYVEDFLSQYEDEEEEEE